jgi:dTDP-glucose 4,6-dehydratase
LSKFFITGGAGFVGSHLSEYIHDKYTDSQIIIYDKLTYAGNLKYLKKILRSPRVKFIKGDIIDYKKYIKLIRNFDFAINVAAESHVDNSFGSSIAFNKTNTYGAHIFLQSSLDSKVKKIIHVSTDEVYGEKINGISKEIDFLNPTNPYSATKAAAEIIINSYKYYSEGSIVIVRANNLYGIRQYPEKLIPKCITSLISGEKIPIHGNGKYERCYLSVQDFVEAIELLINKNQKGIFNIGGDKYYKNLDIVKIICILFNSNYRKKIKFIKDRKFNDQRYSISSKKIMMLGWKPKRELVNDLPYMISWYKKNINFY